MSGEKEKINKCVSAALGNFDGLHLGHSAVLEKTLEYSEKNFAPCVILFDEHSMKEIKGKIPPMLMTAQEREKLLKEKGFGIIILKFREIMNLSPKAFVSDILKHQINAGAVVCGYNYRFGKNASGDAALLRKLCEAEGIECSVVGEVDCENEAVSSTAVRFAVENGEIEKANHMLGRLFGFSAEVIEGDKRGRSWGLPTINQLLPENLVMPKFGVYESEVTVDGEKYKGVTNIGKRPTVGTDVILSETHILDFDRNIYGENADVRLVRYIRGEKHFASFEKLAAQIKADAMSVRGDSYV